MSKHPRVVEVSTKRKIMALALLCALAPLAYQCSPHDERTAAVYWRPRDRISSGEKFGVKIGGSWESADAALRKQFKPRYVLWDPRTPDKPVRWGDAPWNAPVLSGPAKVSYRDQSWRNGVVTLELMDGRVTGLMWSYSGPFHIDL